MVMVKLAIIVCSGSSLGEDMVSSTIVRRVRLQTIIFKNKEYSAKESDRRWGCRNSNQGAIWSRIRNEEEGLDKWNFVWFKYG